MLVADGGVLACGLVSRRLSTPSLRSVGVTRRRSSRLLSVESLSEGSDEAVACTERRGENCQLNYRAEKEKERGRLSSGLIWWRWGRVELPVQANLLKDVLQA